jgi:hypothetical protein
MVIRYNSDDEFVCPRCDARLWYDEYTSEYFCSNCSYVVDARYQTLQVGSNQNEYNSYTPILGSTFKNDNGIIITTKGTKDKNKVIEDTKRLQNAMNYRRKKEELLEDHFYPILVHLGLLEERKKIINMVLQCIRNADKLEHEKPDGDTELNYDEDIPYAIYFVILYLIMADKLFKKVRLALQKNLNFRYKRLRLKEAILNVVLATEHLRTKKKGIEPIPWRLVPVLIRKASRLGAKKAYEIVSKAKDLYGFNITNSVLLREDYKVIQKNGIKLTYPSDPFEKELSIYKEDNLIEYTEEDYVLEKLHYLVMDLRSKGKVMIDLSVLEVIRSYYELLKRNIDILLESDKILNQDIPYIIDLIEEGIIKVKDYFIIPRKEFFITMLEAELAIQRKSIRYSKANKNKNHKRTRRKKKGKEEEKKGLKIEEEKIKDKGRKT